MVEKPPLRGSGNQKDRRAPRPYLLWVRLSILWLGCVSIGGLFSLAGFQPHRALGLTFVGTLAILAVFEYWTRVKGLAWAVASAWAGVVALIWAWIWAGAVGAGLALAGIGAGALILTGVLVGALPGILAGALALALVGVLAGTGALVLALIWAGIGALVGALAWDLDLDLDLAVAWAWIMAGALAWAVAEAGISGSAEGVIAVFFVRINTWQSMGIGIFAGLQYASIAASLPADFLHIRQQYNVSTAARLYIALSSFGLLLGSGLGSWLRSSGVINLPPL